MLYHLHITHFPCLSADTSSPVCASQLTAVTADEWPSDFDGKVSNSLLVVRSHNKIFPSAEPAEAYRPSGENDVCMKIKGENDSKRHLLRKRNDRKMILMHIGGQTEEWIMISKIQYDWNGQKGKGRQAKKSNVRYEHLTLDQSYVMRSEGAFKT